LSSTQRLPQLASLAILVGRRRAGNQKQSFCVVMSERDQTKQKTDRSGSMVGLGLNELHRVLMASSRDSKTCIGLKVKPDDFDAMSNNK
jgi:hypothetical protein